MYLKLSFHSHCAVTLGSGVAAKMTVFHIFAPYSRRYWGGKKWKLWHYQSKHKIQVVLPLETNESNLNFLHTKNKIVNNHHNSIINSFNFLCWDKKSDLKSGQNNMLLEMNLIVPGVNSNPAHAVKRCKRCMFACLFTCDSSRNRHDTDWFLAYINAVLTCCNLVSVDQEESWCEHSALYALFLSS